MNVPSAVTAPKETAFMSGYLDALAMVERLHRLLLDVIKDEFERVGALEINAVQALLLFNVGENELTAGELKTRGYYQGSNVSYNLKKLVDMGYMHHQRCELDRRSVRVKLTPKGRTVREVVARLFARHAEGLITQDILDTASIKDISSTLKQVERYWTDQIRYIFDVINCLMLSRFTNAPYCPSRPKARPGQALGHLAAIPPKHYPANVQRPCVHRAAGGL